MKIQVFSTYQMNSSKPLVCYNKDHIAPLMTTLDENDEVILYCIECDYKLHPGLNLYDDLIKKVYYEQY
jgi:hypothetical protein